MNKAQLKELSTEALKSKEKNSKMLFGLFIPIILALLFFAFRDYNNGKSIDNFTVIIVICCVGGMFSIWPELKAIQSELKEREA